MRVGAKMKLSYRNKKIRFQKRKAVCKLCWHNMSYSWPAEYWGWAWTEKKVPYCKMHRHEAELGQSLNIWPATKLTINILRGKY